MTKDKLNIPITTAITIATILLSVGGSYALIKQKGDEVDKVKVKAEDTEKKVLVIEVQMDNIEEAVKDTKETLKEQKADIKAILKAVMEK